MSGWATGYSYRCQPVDYSDNPMAMRVSLREPLKKNQHEKKRNLANSS